MNTYKFYSKIDPNKEAIGKVQAEDKLEAILKFTAVKKLVYSKFIELYDVERI